MLKQRSTYYGAAWNDTVFDKGGNLMRALLLIVHDANNNNNKIFIFLVNTLFLQTNQSAHKHVRVVAVGILNNQPAHKYKSVKDKSV